MKKTNALLMLIILSLYIFKGILQSLGIDVIIYILTAISCILSLILWFKNKVKPTFGIFETFILIGLVSLLFSSIFTNIYGAIGGFISLYFNLISFILFLKTLSIEEKDLFKNLYCKIIIILGSITALLGLYQYFFDASIFGLAPHKIYGNNELMNSGRFVRRSTALLGSPQNYSVFLALSLVVALLFKTKQKENKTRDLILKILSSALIFVGGIVSGSRAFTLFVLFSLFVFVMLKIFYVKNKKIKIILLTMISVSLILFFVITTFFNKGQNALTRAFTFFNDWPALDVFKKKLSNMNFFDILFGKGIGDGERLSYLILGDRYIDVYGTPYTSYESYILSLLAQIGIFGMLVFLIILAKAIITSYINKDILNFTLLFGIVINLLFTPSFNGLAISFLIYPFIILPINKFEEIKEKNKKLDVLILIEHRARELETAVLLKYFLEKKNLKCVIDSIKFNKEKVVLKYNPKIVFTPWNYSNKEADLFNVFKKRNPDVIIVNMHHEQLSNPESDAFILPKDDAKKCFHVSWGQNFSKKLINCGCEKSTIIECGNAKLDYYNAKLKDYSLRKEELLNKYEISADKKIVLFAADSFHLLDEKKLAVNRSKGVSIDEIAKVGTICRNDFLRYVEKYLKTNDDTVFVYRPHPSFSFMDSKEEKVLKLSQKFKDNFKCISEDSIRDWIIHSDKVFSFHSTCVFECLISNTPYILFRSKHLDLKDDYSFFENYPLIVQTYSDFENILKDDIDIKKIDLDVISKEILITDELVCKNIVKFINKINEKDIPKLKFKRFNYLKVCLISKCKSLLSLIFRIKFIKKKIIASGNLRFYNLLYTGDDYFSNDDISLIENKIKFIMEKNKNER